MLATQVVLWCALLMMMTTICVGAVWAGEV